MFHSLLLGRCCCSALKKTNDRKCAKRCLSLKHIVLKKFAQCYFFTLGNIAYYFAKWCFEVRALQDSTTSRYLAKCQFIVPEIFINEIEGALGNFGWLVIVCVFINLPCWRCWAHFIKKYQIPQAVLWKQQRLRNVHVLCCLVIMSKNSYMQISI